MKTFKQLSEQLEEALKTVPPVGELAKLRTYVKRSVPSLKLEFDLEVGDDAEDDQYQVLVHATQNEDVEPVGLFKYDLPNEIWEWEDVWSGQKNATFKTLNDVKKFLKTKVSPAVDKQISDM